MDADLMEERAPVTRPAIARLYVPGIVNNNSNSKQYGNTVDEVVSNAKDSLMMRPLFSKQRQVLRKSKQRSSSLHSLDRFVLDNFDVNAKKVAAEEQPTYDDNTFLWVEREDGNENVETSDNDEFSFSPFLGPADSLNTSISGISSLFDFDDNDVYNNDIIFDDAGSTSVKANSMSSSLGKSESGNSSSSNNNNNKIAVAFTDDENGIINEGVDNELSWDDIARKCCNKTAKQCSQQWRKIVKTVSVHEVPWTKEEDEIIRKGVENKLSWQGIAKLTKRRLSRQCSQRWRKVLDPRIKRFIKWTKEEDMKLINLHQKHPNMTNKEMSTYLPGRTSTQCHNRWVEVLNPDLRRGAFSAEEDMRILQLREDGQGWSTMAKDTVLMGRANVALKNRWHTLNRREKKNMKLQTKLAALGKDNQCSSSYKSSKCSSSDAKNNIGNKRATPAPETSSIADLETSKTGENKIRSVQKIEMVNNVSSRPNKRKKYAGGNNSSSSNNNNNKIAVAFTDDENGIINEGVDNELSWDDIARKCCNKTAKQCSQQWRKIVKTVSVHEVPWTKEEDEIIRKGVENKLSWQGIAKLTKRRLSRQCSQRWRKVLDPRIKRFIKWTKEEDMKLINLHQKHPNMTNKEMSTYLPGRTSTQCHNRWVEVLNPDLRRGAFSAEEDMRILQLREDGQGWSTMAKDTVLMGRANVALKTRWRTLDRRKKRLVDLVNGDTDKVILKKKRKRTDSKFIVPEHREVDTLNDGGVDYVTVQKKIKVNPMEPLSTTSIISLSKLKPNDGSISNNNNNNNNNIKIAVAFTDDENGIINEGVDNELSWDDIARKCCNKTAKQCSQQWRKIVKTVSVHEVPWTKEEDEIIRKGVENKLSWQGIAKLTKRRLSRQCSQRWRKVLDPRIKRFIKWTKEEDMKLINLHQKHPNMTNKEMSTYLPGRTSTQCHNRWVEVLNPDLRRGAFSAEEDMRILQLREDGQGWSTMAKDTVLMGRANVALKNRWHTLSKRKKSKKCTKKN